MSHYPPAFGRRMAWDADGTVALYVPDGGISREYTPAEAAQINSEEGASVNVGLTVSGYSIHIFPELRDLVGFFIAKNGGGYTTVETSVDTTNGIDGTWVQQLVNVNDVSSVNPEYRTSVDSISATGVKGVRVYKDSGGTTNRLLAIHIYGKISSGQTPDRIIYLDPDAADAQFTKVLDFGDVPRGQTQTRNFKVKNNSGTLTVNTIVITAEDLYLNAGNWFTFSDDNITFVASLAIGNLGPGVTKLIYMKQVVPAAETLGLQTGRIKVSHASVT